MNDTLYAILWQGTLMRGPRSVAVYLTRESAERTIKQHWPGVTDYKIIKFVAVAE